MNKLLLAIGLLCASVSVFLNTGVANASIFATNMDDFASMWSVESIEYYQPSAGDYFLVDIQNSRGYLINDLNRTYASFPIMSGALRTPTPVKDWVVKEKNIQANRVIFSDSGEFFRMYANGTARTGYGIHGYKYFDYEVARGTKYLSLGCIHTADWVLDIIEESFNANGGSLDMYTRSTVDIAAHMDAVNKGGRELAVAL